MVNVRRVLIGDESVWVEFKAAGYPFKLRKQLKEANDDESILNIIASFVTACRLPTLDGETLNSLSKAEELANVDEQITADIIWKFYDFRAERVREPLSKNI